MRGEVSEIRRPQLQSTDVGLTLQRTDIGVTSTVVGVTGAGVGLTLQSTDEGLTGADGRRCSTTSNVM